MSNLLADAQECELAAAGQLLDRPLGFRGLGAICELPVSEQAPGAASAPQRINHHSVIKNDSFRRIYCSFLSKNARSNG